MHALELDHTDRGDAPRLRRFEALYRGEFAFVWSVARHFGVPAGALDDVVQDVFLTAYRHLDHLRYEVSPRAWLFGVTRRVTFRHRRGSARWIRRHAAFAELARPHAEPPQQRHDDAQQLDHLLARLSDTTRTVWQMTELLEMSAPEIASELGIPLNTVYSRLRLARTQLRALVADAATLDALRDQARRQDPPAAVQQRAWALLLPGLGDGGAGVGLLAWVKTQAAMTTTFLATTAVVVGLAVQPAPRPSASTHRSSAPASPIVEAAPSTTASQPAVAAPATSMPATPPERRLSSRTAPPQTPDLQAHLAEEIALIDRAHAQLAAGDAASARTTFAAHARRFPTGVLVDVREAGTIDALCRQGDVAGAEARARRLQTGHPASAVAQRFANYRCPR